MKIEKYKTRFSLISSGKNSEEKQIFLVTTIEGNEVFYYSGYRVHPDNFIKETIKRQGGTVYIQQVKTNTVNKAGDHSSTINARLDELKNASLIVFERNYKGRDTEFDKETFKTLLQKHLGEYDYSQDHKEEAEALGFFDYYIKYKDEAQVTPGRRRQYATDINKLREYEQSKKETLTFENFDILDYRKFISKGRSLNTQVTIMKRLKAFFNYCESESFIDNNPFNKINFSTKVGTEVYEEPVCMTKDELTLLYEYKMADQYKELIKDMFCLQASLGCRVGDFVRLTFDNLQDGVLTYYPSKTKEYATKVTVPLSNRALSIINKYRGRAKKNLIFPFVNTVEYNIQIKEVFKAAKLDRKIVRFNRDKGSEEIFKLCDIASSHLARRTFVDILCQAGEPIHVVASMSGHSERSKAFDRYRRRPEQLQKDAISRSMD